MNFFYLKNGEKIKSFISHYKALYKNKVKPIDIAKNLNISKQRVNYWIKMSIKSSQS